MHFHPRWARASLAGVALLALAGCDCGAAPRGAPLDAGADAGREAADGAARDATPPPYAPRDSGPRPDPGGEPCASGIRAVAVDVPPLAAPYRRGLVHISGRGDEVWVAQTDFVEGRWVGRLTIADAVSGEQRYHAQAELPLGDTPFPRAIRRADGYEVLFTIQPPPGSSLPFAAVVRFDADGGSTTAIAPPSGAWVYWVHAGASDAGGFVVVAQTRPSRDVEFTWTLLRIADGAVTSTPLGLTVDAPTVGGAFGSVELADAEGPIVHGALTVAAPEGQSLLAVEIDVAGLAPRIRTREIDRFPRVWNALAVDDVNGRVVVASRVVEPALGVRYYWLDRDLLELARWDAPVDGAPLGAGGGSRHALAFYAYGFDVGLHVAVADAPGVIRGGARVLANGFDLAFGARGSVWESAPGTLSLAFLRAGVEVVTFCGAR